MYSIIRFVVNLFVCSQEAKINEFNGFECGYSLFYLRNIWHFMKYSLLKLCTLKLTTFSISFVLVLGNKKLIVSFAKLNLAGDSV